jgi:hypothetical protein
VPEFFDVPEGVVLFDTAEEAALSGWAKTPGANATVVRVEAAEPGAVWVVLQLAATPGIHDQDVVTCCQTPTGQWWSSGSSGGSSNAE